MEFFVCYKCQTVDRVSLVYREFPLTIDKQLCTCCNGKPWHNQFKKEKYNSLKDSVVNRPSNLSF